MSRLQKIIKKYNHRASAHTPAKGDDDITLQYEAIRTMYEYICIRDAVRYPGRVARPVLKQWLDDNLKRYTEAYERIYAKIEEHVLERYRKGYVRGVLDTDVLVIGGEILCPHSDEVNSKLRYLFNYMAERVRAEETRFFYINTNLLYEDRTNLDTLLQAFEGLEDRLKFTTSCDPYGRFRSHDAESLFVRNLEYLRDNHPKVNVVMNMIMTHQFFMQYMSNGDDGSMSIETMEPFGVKYVNLLPYIPVEDNRTMDVTKEQILTILEGAEAESPGYFANYVRDYDVNQNRTLYEYHKDKGFTEATAETMECGHNKNFSKVTEDGKCFVCMIKEYLENWDKRFEGRSARTIEAPGSRANGKIIPILMVTA